jgi:hypothetical protein
VALLQEVPPWWPPALGPRLRASARTALTSRNWLLPLTRRAARRRPDVIKSWGGGANAILVRGERVLEHRLRTLRAWPERRVVHGVRLRSALVGPATSTRRRTPRRARRPTSRSRRDGHGVGGGRARRARRRPQHPRTGRRGVRRTRPATASTTCSCNRQRGRPGAYAAITVGSRTTLRCGPTLPRKDRDVEAS